MLRFPNAPAPEGVIEYLHRACSVLLWIITKKKILTPGVNS